VEEKSTSLVLFMSVMIVRIHGQTVTEELRGLIRDCVANISTFVHLCVCVRERARMRFRNVDLRTKVKCS
jgi:hypothetical protein